MKFNNRTKEALYLFMYRAVEEKSFSDVYNCVLALKDHSDYRSYSDNVIKSIQPIGPEVEDELERKYSRIRSNLGIVASDYYGRDLSLQHIKRDYAEEIATNSLDDESLKQQITTFTSHLLFGRESSGIDIVGELPIEQEGLVPMMNKIMSEVEGDSVRKNELMKHFNAYKHLSEQSSKEAAEARKHDPRFILRDNTIANRGESRSSIVEQIITRRDSKEDDSKESDTRGTSFAERYPSNKKTDGKKSVSFPDL